MTETELKKEITDYLKQRGYKVYRMQSMRIRHNVHHCPPGTPDLLAVGFCDTIWIEVKKPGEKLSDVQKKHIAELQDRRQTVIVADSIEDIMGIA